MAAMFRELLGRWVQKRDAATWIQLFNGSLVHPLGHLHPSAWSPLCAASRRLLVNPRQASALAAQHLWTDLSARRGETVAPVEFALRQPPMWHLVMGATRRELLVIALWCGAMLARRQVTGAVDRASAMRWRSRLTAPLYADVLGRAHVLGRCNPMPPARELTSGRLLLDLGLSMLATWSEDPQGWSRRRIELSAGPHRKPAEHYLGPDVLQPADTAAIEPAVLAFVERHCHVG